MFAIADAAFIFSGNLVKFLPVGIGITLASTAILAAIIGLKSRMPGAIAVQQEATVVSLATLAASISLALPFSASDSDKLATIIGAIALATVLTGAFLFLLGTFRLARLIRFVPVPVVGGFLAGIGCLVFFGALGVATGITPSLDALHALLELTPVLKMLFAAAFAAVLWFTVKRAGSPLAGPALIILATIVFHAIGQVSGHTIADLAQDGWFINLPDAGVPWPPVSINDLGNADWKLIISHGLAIATMMLVTAMALLMNLSNIEMSAGAEADIEKEFRASGEGNLVAGLLGGTAGFHGVSPTVLNLKLAGNNRIAAVIVALACLATLFFGAKLIELVPLPVFGGLLLWAAVALLKQWLIDPYHQLTAGEYAVILLMALVISAAGFVAGLVTGLVAGIVLLAVDYSRVDVVKTRLTGDTFHSKRTMSDAWRAVLHEHGQSIVIMRLQGFIFFGTAHQFVGRIKQHLDELDERQIRYLVLDMQRTTGLDSSAAVSFAKLEQLAIDHRFKLVLTDVPEQVSQTLKQAGIGKSALTPVRQFDTLDLGLLWCEEKLILRISPELAEISSVSVKERFVDELFDDRSAQTLLKHMQKLTLAPGDVLIEQGTESQELYFIESGSCSVELRKGDNQAIRLNTAEPGSFVGEISFYLGQERSATVVCERAAVVWQFSRQNLEALRKAHPDVASSFHQRMAVMLADRLSMTTRLVQNLVD